MHWTKGNSFPSFVSTWEFWLWCKNNPSSSASPWSSSPSFPAIPPHDHLHLHHLPSPTLIFSLLRASETTTPSPRSIIYVSVAPVVLLQLPILIRISLHLAHSTQLLHPYFLLPLYFPSLSRHSFMHACMLIPWFCCVTLGWLKLGSSLTHSSFILFPFPLLRMMPYHLPPSHFLYFVPWKCRQESSIRGKRNNVSYM